MVNGTAHLVRPGHVGRPDAGDAHAVVLVEHLGLELVENLVRRVLAVAEDAIIFVGLPVAKVGLLPADGHGTGVHDAVDAQQPPGLKAVVHAQDVEAHLVVRVALAAAQQVGQVDDAVGLRFHNGVDHLLKLGDVHPGATERAPVNAGNVRYRVDVRGVHVLAPFHQLANDPRADETGAAQNQNRHNCTSIT